MHRAGRTGLATNGNMRSFRIDKMGSFIRSLVSEAIAHKINDPRVSPFASVTRVDVSGDLQLAKVYVSVMGSEAEQRRTMAGLEHARGHIQRLVGSQLRVRHVPELRFVQDDSIKGAAETVRQIDSEMEALQDQEPADGDPADPTDLQSPDSQGAAE
jgi:ribosome-binding factor A